MVIDGFQQLQNRFSFTRKIPSHQTNGYASYVTSLNLFPSSDSTFSDKGPTSTFRNRRVRFSTQLFSSRSQGNGRGGPSVDKDNPYYKGMDAYQILEVPRTATKAEIKKAYKKLVFQWHADRVDRDDKAKREEHEKRMKKINWAYWCLEDEERRKRYDKYGDAGVGTSETSEQQLKENGGPMPQGFGGFGGAGGAAVDLEGMDVGDLFEAFFGGGSPFGAGSGFGGRRSARREAEVSEGNASPLFLSFESENDACIRRRPAN